MDITIVRIVLMKKTVLENVNLMNSDVQMEKLVFLLQLIVTGNMIVQMVLMNQIAADQQLNVDLINIVVEMACV